MEDKVKWPLAITSLWETGRKPKPEAGRGKRGRRPDRLLAGEGTPPQGCSRRTERESCGSGEAGHPSIESAASQETGSCQTGKTPGATGEHGLHAAENGEQLALFLPLNLFGEESKNLMAGKNTSYLCGPEYGQDDAKHITCVPASDTQTHTLGAQTLSDPFYS